jgi:MAPEG family
VSSLDVQVVLASHAASVQRGYLCTAGPRDEAVPPLTGIAGRLERALRNFVETFLLFASAVLIAYVANTHKAIKTQDNSGEIAGSTSYLRLIPLLPLNEFFKQSLGCIGPFVSRSSGGRFGNCGFRVFAFLRRLKLPESLKQRLRVFGRHLSRRSRRRSGNGNGNFRGITFWLRKSV